ncbi:MAG: L-histidine N(alpha)-methyltransferase [Firmicutes bacterium]|nr:L-histidine N(alpha)-methyltransferase [Bacillota bacterium]
MQDAQFDQARLAFREAVWAGLQQEPKRIPSKYLYDAQGMRWFEAITRLPEYYLTRAEVEILQRLPTLWPSHLPSPTAIAELGPGSGEKAVLLLRALPEVQAYIAVDIAAEALDAAVARVRQSGWAGLSYGQRGDWVHGFKWPALSASRRMVAFLGSSIGNFEPDEARAFLHRLRRHAESGELLLVGVDLVKDERLLWAAYNDPEGVTAGFNCNLLHRINRELDGNFAVDRFYHVAPFNAQASRVEMHLVSLCDQEVAVAGRRFSLRRGEQIVTEYSYKYTVEGFQALLADAGWKPAAVWHDHRGYFSLHLAASS